MISKKKSFHKNNKKKRKEVHEFLFKEHKTIIFSALIGILFFKEMIDFFSIVGMLLIIGSGIFVSIKQSRFK